MNWSADRDTWRFVLQRHAPRLLLLSLLWELAQLPLYALWRESSPAYIAYAIAHCTAGDVLIGTAALLGALLLLRARESRHWPGAAVIAVTVGFAMTFTVVSERINLLRGSWTYAPAMPVVPWLDVGLSPLLQWLVVPLVAWWWARRTRSA